MSSNRAGAQVIDRLPLGLQDRDQQTEEAAHSARWCPELVCHGHQAVDHPQSARTPEVGMRGYTNAGAR